MKKFIFLIILILSLTQYTNLESATESHDCSTFDVESSVKVERHQGHPKMYHMPTESQLLDTLISKGFIDPIAVWRISIWESGHLRSEICRTRNNIFGLRKNDYIYFKSWIECVDYMKRMEDIRWAKYSLSNSGDYYDYIYWCGYKTGRSRSVADLEYVKTLKTLNPPQSL